MSSVNRFRRARWIGSGVALSLGCVLGAFACNGDDKKTALDAGTSDGGADVDDAGCICVDASPYIDEAGIGRICEPEKSDDGCTNEERCLNLKYVASGSDLDAQSPRCVELKRLDEIIRCPPCHLLYHAEVYPGILDCIGFCKK